MPRKKRCKDDCPQKDKISDFFVLATFLLKILSLVRGVTSRYVEYFSSLETVDSVPSVDCDSLRPRESDNRDLFDGRLINVELVEVLACR